MQTLAIRIVSQALKAFKTSKKLQLLALICITIGVALVVQVVEAQPLYSVFLPTLLLIVVMEGAFTKNA